MRAVWLEDGTLSIRNDVARPRPPPGEALVRVLTAGICNTDLELCRGYYPFAGVLGHEFVGVVDEGPADLRGRRVVGEINAVCGACPACRNGRSSHCEDRTVLGIVNRDGAFAEFLTLPAANLHIVPDSLATDHATFVEPVAAALEIQQQVRVGPADRVIVIGDGKLGLLVAQTLALTGCELLLVGRHPEKLAIVEAMGVRTGRGESVGPGAFDLAVECTGNPEGFALARRALRPRGTLVMKSTYAGSLAVDASSLVVDELTLIGSRCGPFEPAIRHLDDGRVEVAPMVQGRFPLEDGLTAFERAREPGVLKVLLEVSGE